MKKIIISAIAVIAAVTLCACGSSSTVNEAVNTAKQKKIENMSYELAAGSYILSDMTDIGSDKTNFINEDFYTENTIELFKDGQYIITITINEKTETKPGKYQISSNGSVTLDDGNTFVASKDEEIRCDGETLIFEGKLGAQRAVSLFYKKDTDEEENKQNESVNTEAETDNENETDVENETTSEDNTETPEAEG